MRRRLFTAATAAVLGLLAVLAPLAVPTPAAAELLPGRLSLVSGQLQIRDSQEPPAALELPTTLDLTVDDANGRITAGSFAAAPLEFSFPITDPIPATVYVDASFTQITPGVVTSNSALRKTSETTADVTVGIDVRVDLHIEVGRPAFATADCTATPVSLRLTSKAAYDYDTSKVTLEDGDFRVPAVPTNDQCPSLIADGVNERLAGGGHRITMNTQGDLPFVRIGICPTTTTLDVAPLSSREGDEVTLSAKVVKKDAAPCSPPPAQPITGVIDFLDGATVLGSVPLDGNGEAALTISDLPVGSRSFTAKYNGDEVYKEGDPTAAVAHLVAAAPTVALPEPVHNIVIEGNPRPVTVAVANPGEFGETISGARLDLTVARVGSISSVLTPDRMSLEYFNGSAWTPVTLTQASARVLRGSVSGLNLEPGDDLDARFRYRAFAVGATPSTTACAAANPTCPGPITLTAELFTGDGARTLAKDEGSLWLVEATRRPTTVTFSGGVVRPHTVRQGYSLLAATGFGPSFGGVPWAGVAEAYLDGVQVPMRDTATPFETGYQDQFEVKAGAISPWILLPADIEPGPHRLTMRYLGDPIHGPGEVTGVFTVIESPSEPPAHPFICRETTLTAKAEWGANVVFDADLPATTLAGTETSFTVGDARLLMHRRTLNGLAVFAFNDTTTPVGTNGLQALSFDLSGQGEASGTAVTRTGDSLLPNTPYPAPESAVDQTFDVDDVTGSFTVAGEPGEVVPVELSELVFGYTESAFGLPFEVRCTARGGPMELGEVEIAGTTVTATPNPAREGTDEVTIEAETFPADAAGSVSFSSSEDGALGNVTVVDGKATLTTDELSDGAHLITATFNATDPEVPDSQGTTLVGIQYSPRTNTEAFVVAARLDYTGSAEKDDVVADAARLDGGLKKSAYLAELSKSDEYLTHVVQEFYRNTLGREGEQAGVDFWVGRLRAGYPPAKVAASFYSLPEFYNKVGGNDEAWVRALYDRLLGRNGDAPGVQFWIGEIGKRGRGNVAYAFYQSKESGQFRVRALYDYFLDRNPSTADLNFWTPIVLKRGDLVLAVNLTVSNEYKNRAQARFPNVT